jgi:hypothetical protein
MKEATNSTPAAWKSGSLSYDSGLTLDIAKKMLEAGEKEAEKQGVPMSMAIGDVGGNLIAFRRMDNAALFSIQIAMDKAFTRNISKIYWALLLLDLIAGLATGTDYRKKFTDKYTETIVVPK